MTPTLGLRGTKQRAAVVGVVAVWLCGLAVVAPLAASTDGQGRARLAGRQPAMAARQRLLARRPGQVRPAPLGFLQAELRGLRLTDDERAQVSALRERYRPELQALTTERRTALQSRDGAAIQDVQRRIRELQGQMREEAMGLLTAEQKQQVQRRRLTEEQRAQMAAVRERHQPQLQALAVERRTALQNRDHAAIQDLQRRIRGLRAQMQRELMGLLTPEQRQRMRVRMRLRE